MRRWTIELDELQRAVAAVDPSAILVPSRILRRVVKRDRRLYWLGRARSTCYVIPGMSLESIVSGPEVGRPADQRWPTIVILIARPEPEELTDQAAVVILTKVWRRLFHAQVVRELGFPAPSRVIDLPGLAERISEVGWTEFEEARGVLRKDGLLPPPDTDHAAYQEFAAVFLELTYFEPDTLPVVFPAIEHPERVLAVLARDLDGPALLARTRPAGAPERPLVVDVKTAGPEPSFEAAQVAEPAIEPGQTSTRWQRFATEARSAAERGNSVRAAILWTRLARQKGIGEDKVQRAAARAALKDLAVRLRKALFVQKGQSSLWANALLPLLDRAASEFWSPERRLLHDLQNVCLDHEREVFRLEPVGWMMSLGLRPLRHPLPHLREVTMARHLRSAARRLRHVRLTADARLMLEGLLRSAVDNSEKALRERFRPWVDSTLESIWVRPANLPEHVAYRKLVEEVLDPIVSRGFTTLGDLRDAASRSNLKLQDLTGAGEFLRGNLLLQADQALDNVLDGVHRRGEVYLRWLQRLSTLAFGTSVGRFLTLHLVLPFGGAFVLLKGLDEINEVVLAHITGLHIHLTSLTSLLVLGTVALGVINYVRFRRPFLAVLRATARVLRAMLLDWPSRLFSHPLVRRLIASKPAIVGWRFVLKPGLVAALIQAAVRLTGQESRVANTAGVVAFLAAAFLFNTRAGQIVEEVVVDQVSHAWRGLIFEVIPGLFHIIMTAFDRGREWIEKLIYAGDEWLRFREGQSRGLLVVKAVLGLFWSALTYAARIYLNLLVEPQLNPIKHFPVVTVAAKIMLPFALTLTRLISLVLTPFFGSLFGNAIAAVTVFFLPGVFGFLVWELRSNWRLYEANRPASLGPVAVGSHGETVVRLLRPGFHSGTLPKLFGRLRRALGPGREGKAIRNREKLYHALESVRRLVDRDFAALLHESRVLGDRSVEPGQIRLATNRIRIELVSRERGGLWIDLVERGGLLAAGVSQPGWLDNLSAVERRTLGLALAGFYRICGVELVHHPGERLPGSYAAHVATGEPGATRATLTFSERAISWREWVLAWEAEAAQVEQIDTPYWGTASSP